ncbi:MAG: DNA-binding protein [Halorhodospira sp.]
MSEQRHHPLSEAEVRDAVYACLGAGQAPSADRLLAHLGHGSKQTVLKLRARVIEQMQEHLGGSLPADIPEDLYPAMTTFWNTAQEVAHQQLAAEREELERQRQAYAAERDAALEQSVRAQHERDAALTQAQERAERIEALQAAYQDLEARMEQLRTRKDQQLQEAQQEAERERRGLAERLAAQESALQEAQAQLERERSHWADQEAQYVRRFNELAKERDAAHERTERAEERLSEERQRLERRLSEAQEGLEGQRQAYAQAQARLAELEQAQAHGEQERAQLQARLEQSQLELERRDRHISQLLGLVTITRRIDPGGGMHRGGNRGTEDTS